MNQNEKGPCADCTKETGRHSGCHDSCIRKAAWDLTWDGVKAKQRQTDVYEDYINKKKEEQFVNKSKRHNQRKKGY